MTEIIIAIVLYLGTLTGGQPTTPEQKEIPAEKQKDKKEAPLNSQGGTGVWNEYGNG